tara:strand:- start:1103 stop:3067 length:1965 start_codon:yes stop_codon:yes gene_type:complete
MVKNIIFVNKILWTKLFKMKYIYISIFFAVSSLFAQISLSDVKEMSNDQLDLIKEELSKNQESTNEILDEEMEAEKLQVININEPLLTESGKNNYFGYDYFKREVSFFDNVPAPKDFRLGPGDKVIISLWGETNLRKTFNLNREGMIFYEKIGFLNLSNKNLSEAQDYLTKEFSKVFSTLKEEDGRSNLTIEVGELKSINVYFTGQITSPGIHLIHPFSDLFSAIIQAGGINQDGSLRNISIIRNNNILSTIDFYNFFVEGKNNFADLRLIDGDIIHIPTVSIRAEVKGEVIGQGFYEMIESENINDLIKFSGGTSSRASQSAVLDIVIPVAERTADDYAISSMNIESKNFKDINLNNGDKVTILGIPNVESKVEVLGRVKNPGLFGSNSTLKEVLDLAGGFNDPNFRKTINEDEILLLRKDSSSFYSKKYSYKYKNSEDIFLQPEDKILVYENINYRNNFTYRVGGEVNKPGTYPLEQGITLSEAIQLAGGLTQLSSFENVKVDIEFTEINDDNLTMVTTQGVADAEKDFIILNNTVITALPKENVIRVDGNVYSPGLIALERVTNMSRAIELAGGYKPYSLKKQAYVKRANGKIEKAGFFSGRAKRVFPGDTVFVPVDPNPSEFDVTTFVADLSSTLANIAAILIIADNNSN